MVALLKYVISIHSVHIDSYLCSTIIQYPQIWNLKYIHVFTFNVKCSITWKKRIKNSFVTPNFLHCFDFYKSPHSPPYAITKLLKRPIFVPAAHNRKVFRLKWSNMALKKFLDIAYDQARGSDFYTNSWSKSNKTRYKSKI